MPSMQGCWNLKLLRLGFRLWIKIQEEKLEKRGKILEIHQVPSLFYVFNVLFLSLHLKQYWGDVSKQKNLLSTLEIGGWSSESFFLLHILTWGIVGADTVELNFHFSNTHMCKVVEIMHLTGNL